MHLHLRHLPFKQRGAFLVIALILLIILSAIGVAMMSTATASIHVSRNYSQYLQSKLTAISMAGYGKRILESFQNGVYSGPGTCSTTATCNVINNNFPKNGRPILPWASGLNGATMFRSSETKDWWNTHSFAYEASFGGSVDARVIVELVGANHNSPYQNTYRIVGFATDSAGTIRNTSQIFHVWNGYHDDPGDGTCAGKCHYGECCSNTNVCATDATSCENGTATYVPPGWTCTDYFVTGLGFNSNACTHPVAPPI